MQHSLVFSLPFSLLLLCSCCTVLASTTAPPPAPWPMLGIEKLYIFPVLPLAKAPKPPALFSPFNQAKRWMFLGGTGFMVIVKYSRNTPIGAYDELFYLPGRYRPNACDGFRNTSALSTQRIWVDTQASLEAGRVNWGAPKELATFTWTNVTRPGGPAAESVVVRAGGKTVVLNATFTIASPAIPPWLLTPAVLADLYGHQLLWPLNATSPARAVPNLMRSPLTFVSTMASANPTVLKLNSRVLTGVAGLRVSHDPDAPVLAYWNGSISLPLPSSPVC